MTSAPPVVAPSCGYYADQGPVLTYVNEEQHFDPDSLWRALDSARQHRGLGQVTVAERRAQRARCRELPHRSLPEPASPTAAPRPIAAGPHGGQRACLAVTGLPNVMTSNTRGSET